MAATVDRNYERLASTYPVVDVLPEHRLTTDGVLDKLAGLVFIVACMSVLGAFVLPAGLSLPLVLVAFGLAMAGIFKPQWAKVCAPLYAVCEGIVLGAISRYYSDFGGGIVPLAVLFTGGVFLGCLVAYRTGLVKVTPRFMMMTAVATLGLLVVMIASLLGLPIPGIDDLGTRGMIFGAIALCVGVLNLFVDFEQIRTMEERGAHKDGEWYGALILLTSLVLVYLSILRILASSSRR
jgi:uncharacterized YccA/Bax inhibitor family protein